MRPGAAMRAFEGIPDTIIDGEFLEVDPPRRLVQTWRMLMDAEMAEEGFTRLTHEIEAVEEGVDQAHRDPRARGRAEARARGRGRDRGRGRRRRLGVGAQRPQAVLETGSHMAAS